MWTPTPSAPVVLQYFIYIFTQHSINDEYHKSYLKLRLLKLILLKAKHPWRMVQSLSSLTALTTLSTGQSACTPLLSACVDKVTETVEPDGPRGSGNGLSKACHTKSNTNLIFRTQARQSHSCTSSILNRQMIIIIHCSKLPVMHFSFIICHNTPPIQLRVHSHPVSLRESFSNLWLLGRCSLGQPQCSATPSAEMLVGLSFLAIPCPMRCKWRR